MPVNPSFQLAVVSIIPLVVITLILLSWEQERLYSRRLLVLILLILSVLTIVSIAMSSTPFGYRFPDVYIANLSISFLGPLMFFYIRTSVDREFRFNKLQLLWYAPVVLLLVIIIILRLTSLSRLLNRNLISNLKLLETIWLSLWWIAIPIHLRLKGISLKGFFIDFHDLRMTWFRVLYFVVLAIWINKLYLFIQYAWRRDFSSYLQGVSAYFILFTLLISTLLFVVVNRKTIIETKKTEFQGSASELKPLFDRLDNAVQREMLYLDPEIGLFSLSKHLNIPIRTLSRAIHVSKECNFSEYINRYRIEYAKELLETSHRNEKLLAVMYDSGFNSKSAFNSAFKKMTGLTPHQYREKAKQNSSIS